MKFIVIVILVVACSASSDATTTVAEPGSTTTSGVAATSTTQPPVECPLAPYEIGFLPPGVGGVTLNTDDIENDVWTSVGGSATTFVGRNDGTVAIALIRGTLPAVDWPGEKGEVLIDGTRAAVGPHPDGTWVVGWFEQPGDRCDLYTMVFYPPVVASEVEEVLMSMNRVGG